MNWKIGDKFLGLSLMFFTKELGLIVLHKNVNYKIFFKTAPAFKVVYKKEVFNQLYYNKVSKRHLTVVDKTHESGYWIYTLNQPSKKYISAPHNFIPLRIKL